MFRFYPHSYGGVPSRDSAMAKHEMIMPKVLRQLASASAKSDDRICCTTRTAGRDCMSEC